VGVRPDWDAGIGCVVGIGVKGPTGAPIMKDRFFLMSPEAHSADTSGPNKLRRDPLPAFKAWNDLSARETKPGTPLPPTVTLRGVIVHAELGDCLRWNRAAYKAPNGIKSPPSGRPWCEGNGIRAVRIETTDAGEEIEHEIPCPNEECPFAIQKLSKPSMSLLFMLRWDGGPSWQAGFPSLLTLFASHSWHTLRNALGLLALVLGTEAVMPWEPEEEWKPGLAAQLGVKDPSLVGFPFAMTVGEKTQPAKGNQPGRRFPVVSFSQEGDLGAWLSRQAQQRRFLVSAGAPLALPPSLQDEELQPVLDVAHVEIEPAIDTAALSGLKLSEPSAVELEARRLGVPPFKLAEILEESGARGDEAVKVELRRWAAAAASHSSAPPSPDPPPAPTQPPAPARSPASGPVPGQERQPEPIPEPEVRLLTGRDVKRLELEAQKAGCPAGEFREAVEAARLLYGAGNVPATEEEKIRGKIMRAAEAARAKPKR